MIKYNLVAGSVGDPWYFGADLDLTLDPTPFFNGLKDAKKFFFSFFFLITYPQDHLLQS